MYFSVNSVCNYVLVCCRYIMMYIVYGTRVMNMPDKLATRPTRFFRSLSLYLPLSPPKWDPSDNQLAAMVNKIANLGKPSEIAMWCSECLCLGQILLLRTYGRETEIEHYALYQWTETEKFRFCYDKRAAGKTFFLTSLNY